VASASATKSTGFSLKKSWRVSLFIGVRITMIRCVIYLLRIFKMFHGLMNNPVFQRNWRTTYNEERHNFSFHRMTARQTMYT
jgi:hypothetical protein